jgi:hypothetical protein
MQLSAAETIAQEEVNGKILLPGNISLDYEIINKRKQLLHEFIYATFVQPSIIDG